MFRYILRLSVLAAVCTYAAPSYSASPRENFESEKLLSSAVAEIRTLNRDQLDAVIDYIAHCEPTPAPERDFPCERATKVVQIKTSQATGLSLIRLSVYVVDKVIPWNRSGTGDETAKSIDRRIQIFHTLSRAAADRYETLSTAGGRR